MNSKTSSKEFMFSAMQTVKRDDVYQSLSLQEKAVFNHVVFGRKSIFFSGQAGAGKSYLLRAIIEKLEALLPVENLAVTAMTGIAAVNIRGQTLHSLFESSLQMNAATADDNVHEALRHVLGRKEVREALEQLEVLLIDEVSMLEAKEFDALELLFRRLKRSNQLFGGVQLIMCGDFMQLPPIEKEGSVSMLFESERFKCLPQVELTNEFRQADGCLLRVLNKIRDGEIDEDVVRTLNSRVQNQALVDQSERRLLENAYRAYNEAKAKAQADLDALDAECEKLSFFAEARLIRATLEHCCTVLNEHFVPPAFPIRLYAFKRQVDEYNKGRLAALQRSILTIVACDSGKVDKIEQLDREIQIAVGSQVMLRRNLLVAQGMCNGTVGVIMAIAYKDMEKNAKKDKLDAQLDDVQVVFKSGNNEIIVKAVEQEQTENNKNVKVGSRKELPIMLCYAVSIHKSEGLTLDSAVLSIDRCFENGQAYVALSRIRSLEGMYILGIDYKTIRANQACIKYHKEILKLTQDDSESFVKNGFFGASYNLVQERTFDSTVFEAFEKYRVEDIADEHPSLLLMTSEMQEPALQPQEIARPVIDTIPKVSMAEPPQEEESSKNEVPPITQAPKIKIITGIHPIEKATAPAQNVVDLSDSAEEHLKSPIVEPAEKPIKVLIKGSNNKLEKAAELVKPTQVFEESPDTNASATSIEATDELSLSHQFRRADALIASPTDELYKFDYFVEFLEQ